MSVISLDEGVVHTDDIELTDLQVFPDEIGQHPVPRL